jgi:hypothetical protein
MEESYNDDDQPPTSTISPVTADLEEMIASMNINSLQKPLVIIRNLGYFCEESHLTEFLHSLNIPMIDIRIVRSNGEKGAGIRSLLHAFVETPTIEDAVELVKKADGNHLIGRKIR